RGRPFVEVPDVLTPILARTHTTGDDRPEPRSSRSPRTRTIQEPLMMRSLAVVFACLATTLMPGVGQAADEPPYTRQEDIIYGRKSGTALTMDVFAPREGANGLGVILVVSGAWVSSKEAMRPRIAQVIPMVERGYTVFAVVHGSQPRFAVPEMLEDLNRS